MGSIKTLVFEYVGRRFDAAITRIARDPNLIVCVSRQLSVHCLCSL